jgi:hypothetical protein
MITIDGGVFVSNAIRRPSTCGPAVLIAAFRPSRLLGSIPTNVHRNVANLAPPQNANYLSSVRGDVLKVTHIKLSRPSTP